MTCTRRTDERYDSQPQVARIAGAWFTVINVLKFILAIQSLLKAKYANHRRCVTLERALPELARTALVLSLRDGT